MPVAGPFYLAAVDEDETTFGVEHHRMDEYVFSARRILREGEPPKLELVIENPREGLLSPLRKQWYWFAWDKPIYEENSDSDLELVGTTVEPLFFGYVDGIPDDLQAETINVTLIARPRDYARQLQLLAETLKVPPMHHPVFTDVAHRDDPMTIFESQNKMIVIDPVTHVVSASDILDAEDGTLDFTEADHYYPSLQVRRGSVPKAAVRVNMSVSWTQTASGYIDMDPISPIVSYSGDGILSDWPKPLSTVAPGLTVFASSAYDLNEIDKIVNVSGSYQWKSGNKKHRDGDALSTSRNWNLPQGKFVAANQTGGLPGTIITEQNQDGFLDPYATDENGEPAPVNIPASYSGTSAFAGLYSIALSMTLQYRAERPHTERISFTLFADIQSSAIDPLASEDSDVIDLSGSDVGIPIVDLKNYTTVSGQHVDVGTIIFPDNPQFPGNQTIQRAVVAGTAGLIEPEFSDIAGDTTPDGPDTLVWASLGQASAEESAPDWSGEAYVTAGTMILPRRPVTTTLASYMAAGNASSPPANTSFSEGLLLADGDHYIVFTEAGAGGRHGPADFGTATAVTLANLPDGFSYFVATTGGATGPKYVIPDFAGAADIGDTVTDGDVTWQKVAVGRIPIGGLVGNVTGYSYFGTDDGKLAIAHGICRARAKLRYASRAVSSSFECSYLRGIAVSLRKSATLHDSERLPGGLVLGKFTSSELIADAETGEFTCKNEIGSAVGRATVIVEVEGDPMYVDDDYVEDDYQQRSGEIIFVPELSDVAYSPIRPEPDEDGISWPLTKAMLVQSEQVMGSGGADAVAEAIKSLQQASQLDGQPDSAELQFEKARNGANSLSQLLQESPTWYDLVLKPLNGRGSFNRVYHVKCTNLSIPRMIDLEAEASS